MLSPPTVASRAAVVVRFDSVLHRKGSAYILEQRQWFRFSLRSAWNKKKQPMANISFGTWRRTQLPYKWYCSGNKYKYRIWYSESHVSDFKPYVMTSTHRERATKAVYGSTDVCVPKSTDHRRYNMRRIDSNWCRRVKSIDMRTVN